MALTRSVEVVLANNDRVTLRVGELFLKVDADQDRADREVLAMELAPVRTARVLWRSPPVIALAALSGTPLGSLAAPSPAAWAAAGATVRQLHEAPPPPWPGPELDELGARLGAECAWLESVLPSHVIEDNRRRAQHVLRPWPDAFVHGDLHAQHVFVDGETVTGILDWSDAGPGDAHYDLACLTLAHHEHLDDVLRGYGRTMDRELIRGWWSYRCLTAIRWLTENGYGDPDNYPEVAMLRLLATPH